MKKPITETNIPGLPPPRRGKVRDIYDLGSELLIVATDRISAFDVVLPTPIPSKGEILTKISRFWFEKTEGIVPNHMTEKTIFDVISDKTLAKEFADRSMVVKKVKPLPVEAIVRGYVSGSGWKEYAERGMICGIALARGLTQSEKLPEPIFTPSTKAEIGRHDENISFERCVSILGKETAEKVRGAALRIYEYASSYALKRGIIIADTKFEFGILNEELILIDEVLSPDSSRFWPADVYKPGGEQPSFDKQFVRDWLIKSGWDKKPPAPELPADIAAKTSEKYAEAFQRLTG